MVNCISVRSLLAISRIHGLPSISTDFLLAFPQSDLDMGFFMEILLEMVVDGNRGHLVLNLNKSLYGLNQASANWFDILKTGLESRGYH